MIKRFGDYENTKAYTNIEMLPKGGYELIVMGVQVESNSKGQYMKIACDVCNGEKMGFFMNDYNNQQSEDKKWHCNYLLSIPNDDGTEQDGWTKRRFKTVMEAFEESNPGYHWNWDESTLKEKKIGGLFNIREYQNKDGEIKQASNLAQLTTIKAIREGTYKLPEDKLLNKPNKSNDFVRIADNGKEFNPFA